MKGKKVFVGMSGGVDSSVAAALLKSKGYDVTGIHLRCWNVDGCAEQDAEDARRAAETLRIPFYVFDFEKEYRERVVGYMVEGYRQGITPNPDVMCNREIKFGLFLEKALSMGADYVATGHYVRLQKSRGKYSLFVAKDSNKDQSYFLWTLTEKDLKHCLFPIGNYKKPNVRTLARKFGLPNAEKKDSQGICFLGKVTLSDFLKNYIPSRRGKILSAQGAVLGEHDGAEFYTIGQRRIGTSLQLPKSSQKHGSHNQKPFYVANKDIRTNTVVVVEGDENPALYRKKLVLRGVSFLTSKKNIAKKSGLSVLVRVRYRQPLAKAKLIQGKQGAYELTFATPQKFIAEGQSAVLYTRQGSLIRMLGGGIIAKV